MTEIDFEYSEGSSLFFPTIRYYNKNRNLLCKPDGPAEIIILPTKQYCYYYINQYEYNEKTYYMKIAK